jgi:hypothetical protein
MMPRQSLIVGAALSPDLNMNVRGWYAVEEFLGFVRYPYPPGEPPDTLHPLRLSNIAGRVSRLCLHPPGQRLGLAGPTPSSAADPLFRDHATCARLRAASRIASRNPPVDPAASRQWCLRRCRADRLNTWEDRWLGCLLPREPVDPKWTCTHLNAGGRRKLPAVNNLSIIGTAAGDEVDVIVRDSGSFLDPRSWQDWWQDQPPPAAYGS